MTAGCATPSQKIKNLNLGMSPEQVTQTIGEPYTIRAAKVYEDGRKTEVWEYTSGFSVNPKTYWIFFVNNKVVQWGEPGDFAGKSGTSVPVDEYKPSDAAK